MDNTELKRLVETQEKFFRSGVTRDTGFRIKVLCRLRELIRSYDGEINEALRLDLGKHPFESYASEHGLAMQEIRIMCRNLKKWSRPRKAYTPMVHWVANSFYLNQPYGRVLIISPWNYPFQLLFMPLIGAVAAGNCVMAKPSRYAQHTTRIMKKIIEEAFDPGHVTMVEGGSEINRFLLEEQFDYIFFTGSTDVGKKIMESASRHLTPISLELGGKSPAVVEPDVHPGRTARRILWGKLLNAGQSCVAPDYLLVHKSIRQPLLDEMKKYLERAYGPELRSNPDYARIINRANAENLAGLLEGREVLIGGDSDPEARYIAPTVLEIKDPEDPLLQREIFGPILPLVEYEDLEEALDIIRSKPRPLALYVFSQSKKTRQRIILGTQSGSGGLNETVVHFVNLNLPFGGVGDSGMGRYHGKYSFETFSYKRSFLKKAAWIDIPVRYPPYGKKLWLIKKLIR
jgi:aldehyde dehydrogenase (NAD+)